MPDLRVLVIASNPLARAGLSALLADQPGLNIVGQAEHDVLDTLDIYRPDVTLWDMGWEPLTYLDRLRDLRDARQPIVALLANVTNAIESTFSGTRSRIRRITRWQGGAMALRWAAAALLITEKNYRRIRGYRLLHVLENALKKRTTLIKPRKKPDSQHLAC